MWWPGLLPPAGRESNELMLLVKQKEQEVRLDSKRRDVKATKRNDRWLMTSRARGRESKGGMVTNFCLCWRTEEL